MLLIVGTDSTWSLRAWICAQLTKINFTLEVIDLTKANYKTEILNYSSSGLVPILKIKNAYIHDSLAIIELFNERANGTLYPNVEHERALSRSLIAELHSSFINLRSECPFTLDPVGPISNNAHNKIHSEIIRLENIFSQAQLPFMFNSAGAVDAFYAILAYRLQKYSIFLSGKAGKYQQSLLNWSMLQKAIEQAQKWKAE